MRLAEKLTRPLALHRIFKLRQRHMMTRAGRFRLRYTLTAWAAIAVAAGMAVSGPLQVYDGFSGSYDVAGLNGIEPATGADLPQDTELAGAALSESMQNQISSGMRRALAAIKKAEKPRDKQKVEIAQGDTLAGVLQETGLTGPDTVEIVRAISEHVNPRDIRPGQVINVTFEPEALQRGEMQLASLNMPLDPVKEVTVEKKEDQFVSNLKEKPLTKHAMAGTARIENSLYGSALRAGIPQSVVAEVIRVYSWDIDFQRDIRQGDSIEVMYEAETTPAGDVVRTGNMLYANLKVGGRSIPLYRFAMQDGRVDYFQPNGQSIRKTLMKTPIDGARLSSGFGMRKHPILGYNKMHKGVDFAAPTGTPIYAAGDGVVEFAGKQNGYGNYVRLRHNSTLKTAYAHMNGFARGIRAGSRVRQGDVIGYVGSTGRSTGPHLHYEVMVKNVQVNPNGVGLPIGEQLEGPEFKRFKRMMNAAQQQYASLVKGWSVAQVTSENTDRIN